MSGVCIPAAVGGDGELGVGPPIVPGVNCTGEVFRPWCPKHGECLYRVCIIRELIIGGSNILKLVDLFFSDKLPFCVDTGIKSSGGRVKHELRSWTAIMCAISSTVFESAKKLSDTARRMVLYSSVGCSLTSFNFE